MRTTELNDVREVSLSAALRNASGKQPSAADRRANLIKVAAEKPVKRGRGRPMVMTPIETEAVRGIEAAMHLAHATAVNAGWYKDPKTGLPIERDIPGVIALMHSELSEALEAHRKDLRDDKLPSRPGIEVEFADLLIRVFDTARHLELDLSGAVIAKNRFNRKRADHKLANRNRPGGKKY